MDDDFSTARVIANMFEIAPIINSFKDGLIPMHSIDTETLNKLKTSFSIYLEEIFGLKSIQDKENGMLGPVIELLLDIRKEAKQNKDFATSDKIRNQLASIGILVKDDKSGNSSWALP
jgi:cysteinyl-tRNA synthetase